MQSFIRKFTIGRDRLCDVPIADESVSRMHAELLIAGDGSLLISDCRSRNGTALIRDTNVRPVFQEYVYASDEVQFGEVILTVQDLIETVAMKYPGVIDYRTLAAQPNPPAALPARLIRCVCGATRIAARACSECGQV